MSTCPRCRRRTPAARGECIYCGESLPFTSIQSAPPQRNIDTGEPAYNTVLDPSRARVNESAIAALASALALDLAEAQAFVSAAKPIPIARSQTRAEAEMIAALVLTCGLRAAVIPDLDLKLDQELLRARRVEIGDGEILVIYSGGKMTVPAHEVKLLVVGALRNTRVD